MHEQMTVYQIALYKNQEYFPPHSTNVKTSSKITSRQVCAQEGNPHRINQERRKVETFISLFLKILL